MKYIVCNLKNSLNNEKIKEYVNIINDIKFNKLIICPSLKYISYFNGDNYSVGMQDYYPNNNYKYVILNHYEKKETKEKIIDKIKLCINDNKKIILCIGSNDLKDISNIKRQLDMFLNGINLNNVIIAYEPYYMISSDKNVDINSIKRIIDYIKENYNNINVLYGGNVNEDNINEIIKICDGVMIGRLSFNPHKLTNILNKIKKSI